MFFKIETILFSNMDNLEQQDKESFIKKYLISDIDNLIFNKIKNILSNKELTYKGTKTKQRRIEKLVNVYLLKKDENEYDINPLWASKLSSIFCLF
jgi:succinyl-CoA synthetase beta subunit